MPSVTRKETRDELSCVHCGKPDVALDHIRERSTAPELKDSPENCVALCPGCHDLKGLKRVKTKVEGGVYQWRWKESDQWIKPSVVVSERHGMLIRESDGLPDDKKLEADSAADEDGATSQALGRLQTGSPAAPSASDTGAGDAGAEDSAVNDSPTGTALYRGGISASSSAPALTHEQRLAIVAEIRDAQLNRQWRVGDTSNAWEAEIGEDFWNLYANELGYSYPSLKNMMFVCEAIPPKLRHDISFGHHAVVYKLNAEERDEALDVAEQENLTVRELRERVHGVKTKIQRWTLEELRVLAREHWEEVKDSPNAREMEGGEQFLDWLSAEHTVKEAT